jgi:hypothetical protein
VNYKFIAYVVAGLLLVAPSVFTRELNLSMEKETGDRFDPAIVDVDYKNNQGLPEPWGMVHHSTTMGKAIRVGRDTVHIFGDGRIGTGIFRLGWKEIEFTMEEEPRCAREFNVDCEGYEFRGPSKGFIYYGEDDDTVVTWELGVLVYATHREYGIDTPIEIMREYPEEWDKWQKRVDDYNRIYERSGVHIRYELKELWLAHYHSLRDVERQANQLPVDIVLAYGTSYPNTCGVAHVNRWFTEGQPPSSMSRCSVFTDLHEIGHSVGLAHGPENQSNQAKGYIWPEFGHGWNDICGSYSDLMSYGFMGYYHSNSNLLCSEIFSYTGLIPAGYRDVTDTAYALNRLRYDVSLINNEDYEDEEAALRPVRLQARRLRQEIVD